MGKWKEQAWTQEEITFLLTHYNNGMWGTEIAEHLGRSPQAIVHKWHYLHKQKCRSTKTWTEFEVQFLIDNYKIMGPEEVARHLKRTKKSVILKKHNQHGSYEHIVSVAKLNTKFLNTTARRWTQSDTIKLREMYVGGCISNIEISVQFPLRTIRQLRDKAARLKLTGKYGKRNCAGLDGHFYDSREEALVANTFYAAGIKYYKNTKYFYYENGEYFIPDFIVNDTLVVEYFGLIRKGSKSNWKIIGNYSSRHDRKIKYFQDRTEIKFIPLYPEDLENNQVLNKVKEVLRDTTSTIH